MQKREVDRPSIFSFRVHRCPCDIAHLFVPSLHALPPSLSFQVDSGKHGPPPGPHGSSCARTSLYIVHRNWSTPASCAPFFQGRHSSVSLLSSYTKRLLRSVRPHRRKVDEEAARPTLGSWPINSFGLPACVEGARAPREMTRGGETPPSLIVP